jgi:catechol 2,3-dioxygenase-like lactoylglutathione lyase family enzyme
VSEPKETSSPSIEIRSAVPTFLVPDVAATARWYAEHLGFAVAGTFPKTAPHAYASLQRGGAEIMLLALPGYEKADLRARRPEGLWNAYVRMNGVERLYESVRGREFVQMPLRRQSYGDLEFEVRDPNGYVVVFGGDAPGESETPGPSRFLAVTPMIPAGRDLDAALAFYTERMGFTLEWRSDTMAGIRRGDVAFNMVVNDNREWTENSSYSIGVCDLDALYAEYRDLPARVGPLEVKAWGRREFHLIVPSGVCLQFYEAERP